VQTINYKFKTLFCLTDMRVEIPLRSFSCILTLFLIFMPNQVCAVKFKPKYLYEEVSKSTVVIMGSDSNSGKKSFGAGSIIHKDGLVLTNAHIIFNKKTQRPFKKHFIILKPKRVIGNFKNDTSRIFRSKLLHYSRKLDLALLKIISKSEVLPKPLKIADSNSVSIGDKVLAIGHPETGGLWSLTTGTISSKINNYSDIAGKDVFQTETSFNRGNSGGPLIDQNGSLVGINSMFSRVSSDGTPIVGINFSIMSNVAMKWIRSFNTNISFVENMQKPRQPIIREASIIPVPRLNTKKFNLISQSKVIDKTGNLKMNKSFKIKSEILLESDMEQMMKVMHDKIRNKKNVTKLIKNDRQN
jgi:serine protease Do